MRRYRFCPSIDTLEVRSALSGLLAPAASDPTEPGYTPPSPPGDPTIIAPVPPPDPAAPLIA